jgi:hypothetical protein
MILKTIFRMLWVTIALMLAVGAALAILFALGAMWVGDELRAAAPHDPVLQHGADRIFGIVLFVGTVTPALTILPALAAVIAGEVLRIRSWMYYVLAGGASLVAIPLLTSPRVEDIQALPASPYMPIFAAAGFIGGFVYWLLAGARA